MCQECSMRVTKVADLPMFCDKIENTSLFMKKNVVNPKGIIIIPYDDKQIILLASIWNSNPES